MLKVLKEAAKRNVWKSKEGQRGKVLKKLMGLKKQKKINGSREKKAAIRRRKETTVAGVQEDINRDVEKRCKKKPTEGEKEETAMIFLGKILVF